MPHPVALVTDSTAYIPQELTAQYDIRVAPQILVWGEETLRDGVDITPEAFYRRLETAKVLPTSTQPSVLSFEEIFRERLEAGYDVLAVVISSDLSGTYRAALQAKEAFPGANIEVVDSRTTAMELGFQVLAAARAAAEGASLAECKAIAEKAQDHTGVVLAVATLEFLHRGGRIGGASRWFGTAFRIKPLLEVRNGRVEPLEKVRTHRKALKRMVDIVVERTQGQEPIRLAALHTNAEDLAREVLAQASAQLNPVEALVSDVSPVVGTHVGPGTVALAYMAGM
ncbi:MAG: DegV family protein [Chloroflexi bacterium]|nr:DegV family protein [Chloroflexota bacterium]